MKKGLSVTLSVLLLLGCFSGSGCTDGASSSQRKDNVLRVASWDEYIDMGGEDSYYSPDSSPLYEEFEEWYLQEYGKEIRVEYVALQDNETMYGKIKMGDFYDLLCPSEYMIMKLAAENRLEPLPASFFDTTNEHNYFAKNLSPYIREIFDDGKLKNGASWSQYAAGYMWGTTGFVFNPEKFPNPDVMNSWSAFISPDCKHKITAKDNVRDNYFIGLGMYYEEHLLDLQAAYTRGEFSKADYKSAISACMNDTNVETMNAVFGNHLGKMRDKLYGLETDEGKMELIKGRIDASFQWSGDAVYILDEAEENDVVLEYRIPQSVSNMWFDGWVMMKGADVEAATAFINFLSMPQNVIRNMYYIGYTSCIATDEVFAYVQETYGDEEGDSEYDLSYFFGTESKLQTDSSQLSRQLFAQYPDTETIDRLVVMDYFDAETNKRATRKWCGIK